MNNYRNNNRKNRFKSNGDRSYRKRSINGLKIQNDFNSKTEFRHRNHVRNNQNAPKLIEKYNNLAREALSTGDKILSENYFQHADHFTRILSEQETQRRSRMPENQTSIKSDNKSSRIIGEDETSNQTDIKKKTNSETDSEAS